MWVMIYMARGIDKAQQLKEAIESEGIIVKILPVYKKKDEQDNYYKITVPALEAEEAREIVMDVL